MFGGGVALLVPKLGLPNLDMDHSIIFGSFKIHVTCLGVPSEKNPGKKIKNNLLIYQEDLEQQG